MPCARSLAVHGSPLATILTDLMHKAQAAAVKAAAQAAAAADCAAEPWLLKKNYFACPSMLRNLLSNHYSKRQVVRHQFTTPLSRTFKTPLIQKNACI